MRRSRNVWRYLLSAIAIGLVGLAIFWAWPRPVQRTLLLIVSSEREERTSPLVPYVAGDRRALLDWAAAANVPTSDLTLGDLPALSALRQWLAPGDPAGERAVFERRGKSPGKYRIGKNDRLVIYIKAHGFALDVSKTGQKDIQPLLVKRLNEEDLATAWQESAAHVLNAGQLLQELAGLRDVHTLVVFDVVHVNYDPRLGVVVNAFPDALRQAAEKLPGRGNLSVVCCQASGELSAGLPAVGRSAVADCLVQALTRQPKGPNAVSLEQVVRDWQKGLDALGGSGRTSFRQTLQPLLMPSAGSGLTGFALPTSPPPDDEGKKGDGKASAAASKAVAQAVQTQATQATPSEVTAAAAAAQQISQAVASAAPAAGAAPPANATAKSAAAGSGAPPAAAGPGAAAAPAPATPAPAPAPATQVPKSDLELAWEARDRLRANYRQAWTPAHVAPQQWRRIEAVLGGFDEELLPPGEEPRDPQTLATLARDLQTLVRYFGGARDLPVREDCGSVATALTRFADGPFGRTFRPRQAGALDEANRAVRVFAEGLYRAEDYLRLHGQTATVPDGGPLLNDGLLDALLTRLGTLGGLLSPAGLEDGRLTETRTRDLGRAADDVDQELQRLDADIAKYAATTAGAAPSAGKMLRARLLLRSPLVPANLRRSLREQQPLTAPAITEAASTETGSFGDRLATNARLTRKLLEIAVPSDLREARPGAAGGAATPRIALNVFAGFDDSTVKMGLAPTEWAILGRSLQDIARQWSSIIKSLYEQRVAGKSTPRGADLFAVYRLSLLVDGRDAGRLRGQDAGEVAIAQPLLAPRILDSVAITFSPESVQLPVAGGEAASVELTLHITSEKPPPFAVTLDLDWNDREMELARQGEGPALRKGKNQITVSSDKAIVPLRLIARRESREANPLSLTATASFGMSAPGSRNLACVLPRPDLVDITLAGDANLEAARRRTWLPSGQQGGRLLLFANREKAFSVYLTNQSSEEKRVFARLYRVPRAAVDPSGRLFDPRMPAQLLAATAGYDARMMQPNADPAQILRGLLVAQSSEKEPILLPANQSPVRVALAPLAAPAAPAGSAAGAAQPKPADDAADVTSGLVLVLTSADGKSRPYAKWIELLVHQPNDLLEIKKPLYEQGRLSYRVGLKDDYLVEEMGLSKQPLLLAWDTLPLPVEVQPVAKEAPLAAEGEPVVSLAASVASSVTWPIYLQLAADGYPRGLVSGLSWRGTVPVLENFKIDHAPVVHLTRVAATAQRPGAQPQTVRFLIKPERAWLPYPSAAAIAEGIPLGIKGQPVMIRVDERSPTVKIDCDLAADIAARHFSDGARLKLSLAGQVKQFALDRQVTARLAGVEDGTVRLASAVSDFRGLEFEPLEVPQDRRVDLTAEVAGESLGTGASFATDKVTFILDRTPPSVSQVVAEKRPPRAGPPGAPPPVIVAVQCRADDGAGSGVAAVDFTVGFDRNQNDRLDVDERRPTVAGRQYAQGTYVAEVSLPPDLPGEYLLVEAVARDNVEQASAAGHFTLRIPKPSAGGGQRTTYGGKKLELEDFDKKGRP